MSVEQFQFDQSERVYVPAAIIDTFCKFIEKDIERLENRVELVLAMKEGVYRPDD